jgi:GTP-binding protein YchF
VNFTFFGYPKTGKTTLFNILTGSRVAVHAYEDGQKEANEKICPLPDLRLNEIWRLYPEKKKIPASVEFIDLAGISYGEVKTSVFLNALRKADGLVHVVRGFRDPEIPHARPTINPKDDIRTMDEELLLADLVSVEARLERLDKDLKKMKSPEGEKEQELLRLLHGHLSNGRPLREYELSEAEERQIKNFAFLSQKPIFHLINIDESDIGRLPEIERDLAPGTRWTAALAFCGKVEREISEIEDEGDRCKFLSEFGLGEPTPGRFAASGLRLMETIFFYTVGKDEVRAWPVKQSTTALKAAGSIHSEIEKGFIRAEVIPWDALVRHGSLQAAKDKGGIRLEGKDYLVQDGDVVYFRFAA